MASTDSRQMWEAAVSGRPTIGTWCRISSTVTAEMLGRAGFDWVVVDLQHGGMTLETLLPMLQALELGGTPVLVRTPWNEPQIIMRVLDLGAAGVIVPMVNTAQDARRAADAMRYPPRGNRSFGPVRGGYFAQDRGARDVICFVMIETAEGLENVEEIAAVPGVDGLYVGPIDLGIALGEGVDVTGMSAAVQRAHDQVVAAARTHGIIPGGAALSDDHAEDLLRRGITMLTYSADDLFILTGMTKAVATIAGLKEARSDSVSDHT